MVKQPGFFQRFPIGLSSVLSTQTVLQNKKMLIALRGPLCLANSVSKASEEINHLSRVLDEKSLSSLAFNGALPSWTVWLTHIDVWDGLN